MASVCARLAGFAVVFVLFVMLSPLAPGVPRSASAVPLNSPLTPPNFAFSVNGAQMLIDQGTLSSYESWLQSENWTGVTDYLYHQPVDFLFVQYCWNHACTNDTQDYFLFNVEIYEFANTTAALNEFNAQYPYKWFDECTATACPPGSPYMTEGPIFTRFVTWNSGHTIHTAVSVQQLIQRSNFMFFIYYIDPNMVAPSFDEENATYNFTNAYINGLFSVIPGDAVTSPPPSGISPSAPRWGLQVGDNITWTVQKSGCVGNVLSGGACNNDNYDVSLQVVEVADGGRAVEVEGPSQNGWPSDFNEGGSFNYYAGIHPGPLPTQSYTWISGSAPYVDPKGSGFPLLYPAYSLSDLVASVKNTTAATDFTNDAYSVTGTYSEGSPSSFVTSVETESMRIVVYGVGVVTSVDFYFNNEQTAVTSSVSISVDKVNFDMSSRISPFNIAATSTTTVTRSASTSLTTTSTTTIPNPTPVDYTMYEVGGGAAVVAVAVIAIALRRH